MYKKAEIFAAVRRIGRKNDEMILPKNGSVEKKQELYAVFRLTFRAKKI